MHLAHLRLRDFRNYQRLDADFAPGFHLLLGDNAQGKTNILEAIYLMATLRSFRGVGGAQMIRHGQKGYFVGGKVVGGAISAAFPPLPVGRGEGRGEGPTVQEGTEPTKTKNSSPQPSPRPGGERESETAPEILTSHREREIKMYWSARQRNLTLDHRPVKKLGDYLGTLRTVVFCTEDLQLVKGTGRARRRFLDLLLAQTQPGYLALLQRYLQVVRSRNALLKQHAPDLMLLDSYSEQLVKLGDEIIRHRRELIPKLSPLARLAYRRISHDAEDLRIVYEPNVRSDFAVELAQVRDRERRFRATLLGPHRDDLQLLLNEKSAAQFGSEGQKRTLAIALKMAQAEYLTGIHGSAPVLLIDDVMGELDVKRRSGLLPLLERARETSGQVFMTCTEENWPRELGRDLQRWEVKAGTLAVIVANATRDHI